MFDIKKVINSLLIRFPIFKLYLNNIKLIPDKSCSTAATSGLHIFYNEDYLSGLKRNEQCFIFAHEIMHIALKHIERMDDKDIEIWNYATDAVINQMLKKCNLQLPEGVIDCSDALNYSAEEYYEIIKNRDDCEELMAKYRQEEEEKEIIISHDSWKNSVNDDNLELPDISEKEFISKNEDMVKTENREYMENLQNTKSSLSDVSRGVLDNIGDSTSEVDWKSYLTRYKRKIISADYNLNRGDFNEEGIYYYPYEVIRGCDVEIVIDTSGSVDDDLVRSFLRECKTIFNDSVIRIGCFDTKFYGFHDIKSLSDIDNFMIEGRGGTDFNVAVAAFSNKKNLKVIFTDGYSEIPDRSLNALWVIYSNKDLKPKGGTVVHLDPNTLSNSARRR